MYVGPDNHVRIVKILRGCRELLSGVPGEVSVMDMSWTETNRHPLPYSVVWAVMAGGKLDFEPDCRVLGKQPAISGQVA